ncbi:hypothetical protein [Streptomyces sp. NPDC058953]|uniref:hypothetical protein n=1 Tax=unclassified Streptomyces TaxID=2593676 RepID=UPI003697F8D6
MSPLGGTSAVTGRAGAVVLALVLVSVLAVSAKDRILHAVDGPFLNIVDDCEGTDALVRAIDALPVFAAAPPGTRPVKGYESPGGGAGCLDDSGDELVHGEGVYEVVGEKQAVADQLRAAAERDGWEEGPATGGSAEERDPSDLCFEKRLAEGPAVMEVWFTPERRTVQISVVSLLDGTATAC